MIVRSLVFSSGIALAALAALATPRPAAAQVASFAAGACHLDCVYANPQECDSTPTGLYRHGDYGAIFAFGPFFGPAWATECGAGVRASTASPRTVTVYWNDQSADDDFSCHAVVWATNGSVAWWGTDKFSSGVGPGSAAWTIPSSALGYVAVSCTFPIISDATPSKVYGVIRD
jgi:hypothetical protein